MMQKCTSVMYISLKGSETSILADLWLCWHGITFLKKLSPIAFLHLWQSNTRRKIIKRNTDSILRYKSLSDRDRELMDNLSVLLPD